MSGQWGAMPLVYSEEGCDMMGSVSVWPHHGEWTKGKCCGEAKAWRWTGGDREGAGQGIEWSTVSLRFCLGLKAWGQWVWGLD